MFWITLEMSYSKMELIIVFSFLVKQLNVAAKTGNFAGCSATAVYGSAGNHSAPVIIMS